MNFGSLKIHSLHRTALVLALVVVAIVIAFDPAQSGLFPPCPFYWCTGLYCPGCGSLRAFHQLTHGHLSQAFHLNPLFLIALVYIFFVTVLEVLRKTCGTALSINLTSLFWTRLWLVVILGFWVLRNIPINLSVFP